MSLKLEKVLILDGVDEKCEKNLKKAGIKVTSITSKLSKDELIKELNLHDGLIVRSATKVTADLLANTTRLKVIGRAGTGVDNIDVDAATRRGILVMNTPGGNTLSAAEHTCALICSLSRCIPEACASLKGGAWDRKRFMGNELSGKVLAIIGIGRIGKEVTSRMKSFDMTVIGYDPIVPPELAASWGIEFVELEQIWPRADYITVHTPLLPQTRHLVGTNSFGLCKPGVKIINVARGGIVDEAALLKALQDGKCSGAALDVFEEEPPKGLTLTLLEHPRVICTPHLGANTEEAQTRVAVEIADQFVDMSEGRQLFGVVNAPALADAGSEKARPWIKLASSLGSLASALTKSSTASHVNLLVDLYGAEVCDLSKVMQPAVLKGFISFSKHVKANLVNAPIIAKDQGINITMTNHPQSAAPLSSKGTGGIKIALSGGEHSVTLIGSAIGGSSVLYCLNDCVWTSGVSLEDNVMFFSSSSNVPLVDIATALQKYALSALLSSSTSKDVTWLVARTKAKVENVPAIKNAQFVTQIIF